MVFLDTHLLDAKDSTQFKATQELESIYNETEIAIVIKLFESILMIAIQNNFTFNQYSSFFKNIGFISGYRAQNQHIRMKILNKIETIFSSLNSYEEVTVEQIKTIILETLVIQTVDVFQGQEREMIVYSFVDSNSALKIHQLTLEKRRLNVAISRAKKKIIFIGNSATLCNKKLANFNPKIKEVVQIHTNLVDYVKKNNGYQELTELDL